MAKHVLLPVDPDAEASWKRALPEAIQSAGDSVYLAENRHYSPAGHRIVATRLLGFLTRNMAAR